MSQAFSQAIEELASDLDARFRVAYHPAPTGHRIAVRVGEGYPTRPRRPRRLLRHGRFAYDLTYRVLPEIFPLADEVTVRQVPSGAPAGSGWPRPSAGPVVWDAAGEWLAGLVHLDDRIVPWSARASGSPFNRYSQIPVSHSLLGLRGRVQVPLGWLAGGRLLVVRAAIDDEARDLIFDSDEKLWPSPVLTDLFTAAAAEMTLLNPDGTVTVLTPRQVCQEFAVAPDGQHVLVGGVSDLDGLRRLLTHDVVPYRVYQLATSTHAVQDLGTLRCGSLAWAVDEPATLIFCDDTGRHTEFWSARLGEDPHQIAALPDGVLRWVPVASNTLVVVPRSAPDHVVLIDTRTGRTASRRLPGSVEELATAGAPDAALVAVTVRTIDQGKRQYVINTDASTDSAIEGQPAGVRLVLVAGATRLIERQQEGYARLEYSAGKATRTIHETRTAPTAPALQVTHGQLPQGATYQIIRPASSGSQSMPAVVWFSPVRSIAGPGEATKKEPMFSPVQVRPGTPAWTYLPHAAVAILTCPVRWEDDTRFAQLEDELDRALREMVGVLSETPDVDTRRLLVGGHSFGAAAAAMLLSRVGHLFRGAVLRNGAYNRTLTPGGFQHERRTLWQARDVYDGFTLAYRADRITTPVLLIQGAADPNSATTVEQARSFYEALRVAGTPARLVVLHNEGHILHTREGLLTAAREELSWLHRWAGPATPPLADVSHPGAVTSLAATEV